MVTNTKEYMNNYYKNNKDKFKKSASTIIECPCGCKITRHKFAAHKRTKKHMLLMENIELKSKLIK